MCFLWSKTHYSIRNLELLVTIAVGCIGFVSEKYEERITVMQLIEDSKRIYKANKFILYAVADGLFSVLSKYKQGISDFIKPPPKLNSLQLSLFSFKKWGNSKFKAL